MSNKPAFVLKHARGEGDKKYWTRIGVAWPTKSGDGYRLQLDYIPTSAETEIYALPWEEKSEQDNPAS